MTRKPKVLAVDDEAFNLDIIVGYLEADGYEVIVAVDGEDGLAKLRSNTDVDIIVLDRMMPKLDGMAFIKQIKNDKLLSKIPIVMQTAAASSEQIIEGINAGVFYYLTKPYDDKLLLSVVKSAYNDHLFKNQIISKLSRHESCYGLLENAKFKIRTLNEASNISCLIAAFTPNPDAAVYGINELLINAVEHGNLGITYSDKTKLLLENKWLTEVNRLLNLEENKSKFVSITYEKSAKEIKLTITDEGKGFDWQKYIEISPERATDPHGRGIATSKLMSFDNLEYVGNGNTVVCTIKI